MMTYAYAYEVHGIRENGSIFGSVGFERDGADQQEADAEACAVAEHYAKLWRSSVKLYRTPDANMSSVSSFDLWPGQVALITEIPGRVKGGFCDPEKDDVFF